MLGRINCRYPCVMPLVMQRRRRQRAHRILERCEAGTSLRRLAVPSPADRLLKRRSVPVGSQWNAQLTGRVIVGKRLFALCEQSAAYRCAEPKQLPPAGSFEILHCLTSPKLYSNPKPPTPLLEIEITRLERLGKPTQASRGRAALNSQAADRSGNNALG